MTHRVTGRLKGKRAFITMPGQGIGRATALALMRDGEVDVRIVAETNGKPAPNLPGDNSVRRRSEQRQEPGATFPGMVPYVMLAALLTSSSGRLDWPRTQR